MTSSPSWAPVSGKLPGGSSISGYLPMTPPHCFLSYSIIHDSRR
jgi:hypothetical protein